MTSRARAILWAQWRSLLNYYPRSNKLGLTFGAVLAVLWYGMWTVVAAVVAHLFSNPDNDSVSTSVLPGGLLFVFLYWQLAPILLLSSGVSLSTKKLQIYPIPASQLFHIELLLRISTSFEMAILLSGLACGLLLHPSRPKWTVLALIPFAGINLCIAAGAREILVRLFARKRVREITVLLAIMAGALPRLLVATGAESRLESFFRRPSQPFWPWSATAILATGRPLVTAMVTLALWMTATYLFGRWQFERTLVFDADETNARRSKRSSSREPLLRRLPSLASMILPDPLGILVEKEIRFLSRAPRFRLVFTMGFTFGLVIWLPMAFGRSSSDVFGANYLTFVSVYSLLLLGDVCFWNSFGFDRVAAQAYWAMPVPFSAVLAAKNITALFFVLVEVTLIVAVCALLRLPIYGVKLAEAYGVTVVVATYMLAMGNLTSTTNARAINPIKAMRSGAPGRLQALMFLLYPLAAAPVMLAYAARYAFSSEAALFIVLGIAALIGAASYWASLDSAVSAAERNKESLLTALSQGEGVMQA